MRKKEHNEPKVLTGEELKELGKGDPLAVAKIINEAKDITILEEGQEVTLLKVEGGKALILPDGSDKAYWVTLDDIRTEP